MKRIIKKSGARVGKAFWIMKRVLLGLIIGDWVGMFAHGAYYAFKPITHVRSETLGRVFELHAKYSDHPIFLTASEHEPYQWLQSALLPLCGVLLGVCLLELVVEKSTEKHGKSTGSE